MKVPGPEFVAVIRDTLTMFHANARDLIRRYDNAPVAGSQAANEQATYADPDWIVLAQSISGQLVEFGAEHVTALVKLTSEPIEVIACWTCLRSMLEGCATGAWLTDPSIDAKTRAGRVLALHFEGLDQQMKFGKAGDYPAERIKMAHDRLDDIEKQAIALGFAAIHDRNGGRIGIGQRMPTATEMIGTVLDDEATYRMLSGIAHAQSWAIMGLSYTEAKDPSVNVGATKLTMKYEKDVNMIAMCALGVKTASTFARPLWNKSRYFGWDSVRFAKVFEEVFDRLKAPDKLRFWR